MEEMVETRKSGAFMDYLKRIGKWIIARSIPSYLSQLNRMAEEDVF